MDLENLPRLRAGLPRRISSSKVSLLWRPSYNLFTRTYSGNEIRYQKPDELLENRTDSDSDPAVNAFEKEVLKSFLR